jgi:hypothetical protein
MKQLKLIIFFLFAFLSATSVVSQERDWETYFIKDIEVPNPVYKPVVGFGVGYLNFYGDVKNNLNSPLTGSLAGRINMHMYFDNKNQNLKLNFFIMSTFFGVTPMIVRQRNYTDPSKNYNFKTDFLIFGANVHYDFANFIKKSSFLRPFISIGLENISFDSKADLIGKYYDSNSNTWKSSYYNYWNIIKLIVKTKRKLLNL